MQFDAIVGNPPYLNGLWRQFLYRSAALSTRYIAMIAPNGTDNRSDQSAALVRFLQEHGIQAKIDCTQAFPSVASGKIVTYYLDKRLPYVPGAVADTSTRGAIMAHLLRLNNGDLISRQVSQGKYDTMTRAVPGVKRNRNKDSRSNTHQPDHLHTLRVLVSSGKEGNIIRYFQPDGSVRKFRGSAFALNRFFGTANLVANWISAADGISVSGNVLWFPALPGETVESFLSVYGSKLYRMAIHTIKNGQTATTPKHFSLLPTPPLTKVYTEAELYSLLGIQDPVWIEYINSHEAQGSSP
jgi:hypothetical protein